MRFAATKTAKEAANRCLRGTRASVTPAMGAARATVSEKTVTNWPACASPTPRSRAISGRTPAIT